MRRKKIPSPDTLAGASASTDATDSHALETELRYALDNDLLEVLYQPIVNLAAGTVGAEALLRWNHPKWGQIKPDHLIQVSTSGQLIHDIADWVSGQVCRQVALWTKSGQLEHLDYVSINISSAQFRHKDLASRLYRIISEAQIDPSKLCLEFKEANLLLGKPIIEKALGDLRDIGVHLAIDNFGTGYSSIADLRWLPIERIKIDRSLMPSSENDNNAMVTEAILEMAKRIGIETTAVGVETVDQFSFFSIRGCDSFQGNYFSEPLSSERFTAWASESSGVMGSDSGENTLAHLNQRAIELRNLLPDLIEKISSKVILDRLYELHIHDGELALRNKTLEKEGVDSKRLAELFTQLYHKSPIGYLIVNSDNTVVHVNQTLADSLGFAREEIAGSPVVKVVDESSRGAVSTGIADAFASGVMRDTEIQLIKRSGERYIAKLEGRLIDGATLDGSENRQLLLLSVDNITNLKETEQALIVARNQAMAAVRAKSAFLATMSHEIRTPMNAVLGMAELLDDTNLDEVQRDYLATIRQAGIVLLDLINDILDISKIESDKLELEAAPFDMERTIHDAVRMMSSQAKAKNISLLIDYPAKCDHFLIGDVARVRQVLNNLLGNAVKFTEQGRIVVSVKSSGARNGKARLVVSVTDTGIGISAASRNKLFQVFSQVDTSMTRKYGGTGLGLAISKRLIDLMGGRIGVRSKLGEGATFWFSLRLPVGKRQELPAAFSLAKKRVLVVDDSVLDLDIIGRHLRHWGVAVTQVSSGQDALSAIRNAERNGLTFDAALVGYRLSDTDGTKLANTIRFESAANPIPVVLMMPMGERGESTHLLTGPYKGHVVKPVERETLHRVLENVLLDDWRHNVPINAASGADEASQGRPPLMQGRILLVEDNVANQKVAASMLKRLGLTVEIANNGREGLEQWRNQASDARFDLVFMDLLMPEMDGYEAARAIRAESDASSKAVPIIALTANIADRFGVGANCKAITDWLEKPYTRERLAATLEKWLPDKTINAQAENSSNVDSQLPNDEHFRPAALVELKEGLGDDYSEVLPILLENMAKLLSDLFGAVGEGKPDEVRRAAHSLKSSSATVGATYLSTLAKSIEDEAKNGVIQESPGALQEIKHEFERVIGRIAPLQSNA